MTRQSPERETACIPDDFSDESQQRAMDTSPPVHLLVLSGQFLEIFLLGGFHEIRHRKQAPCPEPICSNASCPGGRRAEGLQVPHSASDVRGNQESPGRRVPPDSEHPDARSRRRRWATGLQLCLEQTWSLGCQWPQTPRQRLHPHPGPAAVEGTGPAACLFGFPS